MRWTDQQNLCKVLEMKEERQQNGGTFSMGSFAHLCSTQRRYNEEMYRSVKGDGEIVILKIDTLGGGGVGGGVVGVTTHQ